MIHLENSERRVGVGIAVSEGIKSGAEDHVLAHAARDCAGQLVFRVAAAHKPP